MKPDITFIMARILGPLLLAIGAALITRSGVMLGAASDFTSTPSLSVLGGVSGIGIGLLIAVLHTRFDGVTASIVTLTGWITLVRGALQLLAPELLREALIYVMAHPQLVPIGGCALALIGVWLAYAGYIAGTLRVETTK